MTLNRVPIFVWAQLVTSFMVMFAKPAVGVSTWPSEQWKLRGGTVWGWLSYDPETNLFFYGTGNPGVWNPDLRPGDNKWSCSIFARDADTGEARWAYQATAHDSWDYDEIMETLLVDMDYGGRRRGSKRTTRGHSSILAPMSGCIRVPADIRASWWRGTWPRTRRRGA